MPFVLTNQQLMQNVLAGLNTNIYCVCIDDVIIIGKTYEEQLHKLQLVW